jgi:DNA-binding winged helix-turn-helix (wHTH) protein
MAALSAKAEMRSLPQIDPYGILRFSGRFINVSPTETELMECLIRQFGAMVSREELYECLPERAGESTRNALDLHIMRLRRRIRPLGLAIQTLRGRGYLLQTAADAAVTQSWLRPGRAKPESSGTPRGAQPAAANETGAEVTQLRWPRTRQTAAG